MRKYKEKKRSGEVVEGVNQIPSKPSKLLNMKVPARFELALLDSESNVLTTRLRDHTMQLLMILKFIPENQW